MMKWPFSRHVKNSVKCFACFLVFLQNIFNMLFGYYYYYLILVMCYSTNHFAYGGYILEVIQDYHKLLWTFHNMFVTIIFNGFLLIDMTYLTAKDAVSLNNAKNEFKNFHSLILKAWIRITIIVWNW